MNTLKKTVSVAVSVLALTLGAGLATPASAATFGEAAPVTAQQRDLEWRLHDIYNDYDTCYWAGFDGWNTHKWDHWRCPESLGGYWLMVADD
ncbi:hypothetical protein ACFQ05_18295 [Amycolatopsis umgeniensis]|uniref:Secreted protein n=1 Tax=Amycolatopsis umgeniensis TaxID=336628 RepID=A0A841B9J3_9PSEU|nr:hypothetical protein [Amycolatopsis umgeniensis]MBB5857559.1 hypothetical protein [Amycolatopsis umgeniensis]